uniref:Protein kinase domain-containing protein n=1 Tax=Ascaris lumbricoides TaxID=6252 RepID=A0A0M3I7N0_ASCLU
MGSPIGQIKLSVGDKVRDTFVVRKKLGEGSCGTVFLVESVKDKQAYSYIKAAMKVEPFMKSKDDEILKMEVYVLKKLQKSKHACRLLLAGKMNNFSFLVMSLLGKELSDIRRRLPERRMSVASTLRIGVQSVEAIHDVHKIGFVHRDVKPTNFAMGHKDRDMLFIFDFGLARQIFFPDKRNRMKLREPRKKVSFRGTVRYCSVNVHQYKEQGRHDDLWSMFYMLIELITSTLPWKGMARRDSGRIKETIPDKALLAGCPSSFMELNAYLKKMTYFDEPNYDLFKTKFTDELTKQKSKLSDPFEWNLRKTNFRTDLEIAAERDEKAEIDKVVPLIVNNDINLYLRPSLSQYFKQNSSTG